MIRTRIDFLPKNGARQKTVRKQGVDLSSSLKPQQNKHTKRDMMNATMVFKTLDIKDEK